MQVDYVVIADAAIVAEGKHYIHGGGWDTLNVGSFPVVANFTVAARLAIEWNETNQPIAISVDVQDADGQSILPDPPGPMRGTIRQGRPPTLADGDTQHVPVVLNMVGVPFAAPGQYIVIMRLGDRHEVRSVFRVVGASRGVLAPQ